MSTTRVRVIRSHILGAGRYAEVGEILDLPERVATERITNGSVEPAPLPPEPVLESLSSTGEVPSVPPIPTPEELAAQEAAAAAATGGAPPQPTPEEVAAQAAPDAAGTSASTTAKPAGAEKSAKAGKENSKP